MPDNGHAVYLDPEKYSSKEHFKGIVVLFFVPEMQELAESISASSRGRVVLGSVSFNRFPNAFPNIFIAHAHALKWAHTAFLASLHDPTGIFEQISFIWTLPKLRVRSLSIVIPFFPTATMERAMRLGEVVTAKSLAKMVSATPLTQQGPARVVLCDLHTLQNEFYFDDSVTPIMLTAVPLLLARLRDGPALPRRVDAGASTLLGAFQSACTGSGSRGIAIVFPDEGARKRYGFSFAGAAEYLGQHVEIVTCAKDRDPPPPCSPMTPAFTPSSFAAAAAAPATGAGGGGLTSLSLGAPLLPLPAPASAPAAAADAAAEADAAAAAQSAATAAGTRVRVREGDCSGRLCVIVDDLVRSGGTLEAAARACWAAGAKAVAAFSVHCVFEKGAGDRFIAHYDKAATEAAAGSSGVPASSHRSSKGRGQPPHGQPLISPFWLTDSHPMASTLRGHAPFEVLSLAPLLRDTILDE